LELCETGINFWEQFPPIIWRHLWEELGHLTIEPRSKIESICSGSVSQNWSTYDEKCKDEFFHKFNKQVYDNTPHTQRSLVCLVSKWWWYLYDIQHKFSRRVS
jgi:hypothetical protein